MQELDITKSNIDQTAIEQENPSIPCFFEIFMKKAMNEDIQDPLQSYIDQYLPDETSRAIILEFLGSILGAHFMGQYFNVY